MSDQPHTQAAIEKVARQLDAMMQAINRQPYHPDMCASCRKVHDYRASCAIPDAHYYVISVDIFMAGWGGSQNRTNVCVVPVASWSEATKVYCWVKARSDQKGVRIVVNKPRPYGRKLSLLLEWRYHALGRVVPQ